MVMRHLLRRFRLRISSCSGVSGHLLQSPSRAFQSKIAQFPISNIPFWRQTRRTLTAAAMMQTTEVRKIVTLSETAAVIRYQPGDERFQMQVTLKNGKVFNFDRRCTDPVAGVVARMVTNFSKKLKNFNGIVKLICDDKEMVADEVEVHQLLDAAAKASNASMGALRIQVGEEVYDAVFNPPEVFAAKFLSVCMPTFPIFPIKLETSSNFDKETSLYKWEFSRDKPGPVVPPKLRKKSKDENNGGESIPSYSPWMECGADWVFIPELGMEGGYLRLTITPSNGVLFGRPFTVTLANPVQPLPVAEEEFLFKRRLQTLKPKPEDQGACLRVLSYNVLADTYATPEWFISSPADSLDAGFRLPLLNKEIESYQADLLCLQEVDDKYYEGNFSPFLSTLGYQGLHTSKIGATKEGIATFYSTSKLAFLNTFELVILEHMKTLPMWKTLEAVGKDFVQQRLEERNTVFHVSVFEVKQSPKTLLLVANVHLYFHPEADHVRLLQTITCLDFLESKLAQVKAAYPEHRVTVIFCGDFNCTPPFSSYRLLTSGHVEEDDEDWTSHSEDKIVPGIAFKHSLNFSNSHPGEELTNITTCFEGCLDYILYQSEYLTPLHSYPTPSKQQLAEFTKVPDIIKVSLPNFYTPSDHLPLITDFQFKQT